MYVMGGHRALFFAPGAWPCARNIDDRSLVLMTVKRATRPSLCWHCGGGVLPGDEIWPVVDVGTRQKTKFHWCHVSCAIEVCGMDAQQELVPPPCPFFARRGTCMYGEECFFQHDTASVSSLADGRTFSHVGRVGAFRRFLLERFWPELRRTSTDVTKSMLDIAGGKGELSFELARLNGVHCTIVDPREVMLDDFEWRWQQGRYNCLDLLSRWNGGDFRVDLPHGQDPCISHVKAYFDRDLIDFLANNDEGGENAFLTKSAQRIAQTVLVGESSKYQSYNKVKGRHGRDRLRLVEHFSGVSDRATAVTGPAVPGPPPPSSAIRLDDAPAGQRLEVRPVIDDASLRQHLEGTVLVAGLHLDGAAEAAVDFALSLKKPFAIVPCCTCSKDFPGRQLDGKPVRSHFDLLRYLQRKDPRIRLDSLDFVGKNQVLWMNI